MNSSHERICSQRQRGFLFRILEGNKRTVTKLVDFSLVNSGRRGDNPLVSVEAVGAMEVLRLRLVMVELGHDAGRRRWLRKEKGKKSNRKRRKE